MVVDVFKVQLGLSAVVLALSAGMLIAGKDAAAYLPVITSIVGYWLPAPFQRRRANESVLSDASSIVGGGRSQRRGEFAVHSDANHAEEITLASSWGAAPQLPPNSPLPAAAAASPGSPPPLTP